MWFDEAVSEVFNGVKKAGEFSSEALDEVQHRRCECYGYMYTARSAYVPIAVASLPPYFTAAAIHRTVLELVLIINPRRPPTEHRLNRERPRLARGQDMIRHPLRRVSSWPFALRQSSHPPEIDIDAHPTSHTPHKTSYSQSQAYPTNLPSVSGTWRCWRWEVGDTHRSLLNGLNPAGATLSSMNVLKNTVVARSFHGRPRKHF